MTILRSDAGGVVLALDFAAPALTGIPIPGVEGRRVDLAGCIRYEAPGLPDLPQLRTMCGVVPAGEVRLSVTAGPAEEIPDCDITPAPTWGEKNLPQYVRSDAYQRDAFYPAEPAVLEGIEFLRDVRVARLLISPVQYNPVRRMLRTIRHLEITLTFEPNPDAPPLELLSSSAFEPSSSPFDMLYPLVLANGSTAREWKTVPSFRTPHSVLGNGSSFFDRSAVWVKLAVESTGVYRVGYDDLLRAGVNPDFIDPRTLQLYCPADQDPNTEFPDTMREVPLHVPGEADSAFHRDDYLLFYGRAVSEWNARRTRFTRNLFARDNSYWLTWGNAPGRRMPQGSGAPYAGESRRTTGFWTERIEEDNDCPARSGLLWIWNLANKTRVEPNLAADFKLGLAHGRSLVALKARLYSTSGYNHVLLHLNRTLLDSFDFGSQPYTNPLNLAYDYDTLAAPALESVGNALTLELKGDSAMQVYTDWFEVTYTRRLRTAAGVLEFFVAESTPQTYAVSGVRGPALVLVLDDPWAPRIITDAAQAGDSLVFRHVVADTSLYLVTELNALRAPRRIERRTPGRLRSPAFQADYIIVTPEHLYAAAQPLERHRRDNVPGLRSARVKTVRLDEVYDDFAYGRAEPVALRHFFRAIRPSYGLFLGDATYDYRDILDLHPLPGVPPYEYGYDVNPSGYAGAAYAMDGWYSDFDGNGMSPDMLLGRVTVRTPDELRAYIDKLIGYEQGRRGDWCRRAILLADDEWLGQATPGLEDPIGLDHVTYCETINSLFAPRLEGMKVYLTEYPYAAFGEKPGARNALLRELQRGALLFCFFGHGAGEALTRENAFSISLVPQAANDNRAPFCFFGSCAVGRWEDTRTECISEEMTRLAPGGAVATVGASKATSSQNNLAFAQRMFSTLLAYPDSGIGRAYVTGIPSGMIYHLFGDPALRIALPDTSSAQVFVSETLAPGRRHTFIGSAPMEDGYVTSTLFGPKWLRTYYSSNPGARPRPTTYVLPGSELFRGTSKLELGSFRGSFTLPTGIERGTRQVGDGSYIEVTRSTRLSLVAGGAGGVVSLIRDRLVLDSTALLSTDRTGPVITLFADGNRLTADETCAVPTEFTLTGRLLDSSGVLLAPVRSGDAFFLYVNDYRDRVDLADRFTYDVNSAVGGVFRYPVRLTGPLDTIVVVASDNLQNRTTTRLLVRAAAEHDLAVTEPLVSPNPIAQGGHFTFRLSAPAAVSVRIYTLSGRPVRTVDLPGAGVGFNAVAWDGRDARGFELPNGVYLYSITARRFEAGRQSAQAVIRDRFLIRRPGGKR